jgi:DNA-directed RNA polymerase specialized sigma subunit
MNKTALDWFVEHLKEYGFELNEHELEINKAKQMEKEQIIKAHLAGAKKMVLSINEFVDCSNVLGEIEQIEKGLDTHDDGEEYYNENF